MTFSSSHPNSISHHIPQRLALRVRGVPIIQVWGTDRGNVQIVDPATGSLLIAVQAGFSDEFVEYFSSVDDSGSACGRAAHQVAQTVTADVTSDPDFAPHREIAAASGFQAVQSTPLLDSHSHVVGEVSTHYPRAHRPADSDLALMRRHGELLGAAIEATLEADAAAS